MNDSKQTPKPASPTPWQIGQHVADLVKDANGEGVASCARLLNAEANAALIVAAVNEHDALVAALEQLLARFEHVCPRPKRFANDEQVIDATRTVLARIGKGGRTMTRVYLFADFGRGPRSMGQIADPARHGNPINWSPRQRAAATGAPHPTQAQARAWWLVECESAEAGRRLIARVAEWHGLHGPESEPAEINLCDCRQPDRRPGDLVSSHLEGCACYGRILASGGAA